MSKHIIERMADEANQYLAKYPHGSDEQLANAKTLGLLLWFMSEFAMQRAINEDPRITICRLWESIMVHADQYFSATTADTTNTVLMIMSSYKAPCD